LLVIAAPAQVLTTTDSLLATGLVVAAQHLPSLALGPLAGILADRMNRRTLLVGTDLVRAAAIALLFTADTTPWMVHVAVLIESAATVVLVPAMQAHVPAVVGTGRTLSSANALNAANNGTVRLIGGPLGAALLLAAGFPAVVAIDAATYLVSAIAIALTRSRARPHPRGGRPSFRAGLQDLRGHPVVAALLPATGVFLLANAALSALLVPLGMQRLGGATAIGLVLSALGVGFLLGAPLLRLLVDRMPIRPLLSAAQAMTSVGIRRPGQRDRTTARASRPSSSGRPARWCWGHREPSGSEPSPVPHSGGSAPCSGSWKRQRPLSAPYSARCWRNVQDWASRSTPPRCSP
jgi:hypothetical protein